MGRRNAGWSAAIALMAAACVAGAQTPAAGPDPQKTVIEQKQRQAGAAYSELQKAQHEAKLAEQDFLNAQDAYGAAQKQAEARRQQLEATKKALSAAQAKVAEARKRYDAAVLGVDEAFKKK